jgi:DNA-binding transcriptional LysR family regulator
MQIEVLKIFCDVVRWASFSRGAQENGISQSSASQAVQQLETRLGVKLIDRSKRPLIPTSHGRLFYDNVKDLIARYDEIESRVKSLNREDSFVGTVHVAAIYSVAIHHLAQYVSRFRSQYPGATVRLEYLHPAQIVDRVQSEVADLGILSFPRKWSDLTVIPWREEPMVLAVHPSHRLAAFEDCDVAQLEGETLITFDSDLAIRRAIDRFLKYHGVSMNVALEFDNIENIKRAVEDDAGIAILPGPTLTREVEFGSLAAVPFRSEPLTRPLAIVHRGASRLSPVATRFLDLLLTPHPSSAVNARSDPATLNTSSC